MKKKKPIYVPHEHYQLVLSSLYNKGSAFSNEEREAFNLHGLLPPYVGTLSQQMIRSYQALQSKKTDLGKYIYLRDLQDSNETLFYALIKEHTEEILPLIYTPIVGLGCQKFSHIYRRPRGVFISYPLRHQIDAILAHKRFDDVEVIVVSDGERILGLGDQGAGGMGIPIGKLSLYTALAGIHPRATLPILIDVGTDNQELTDDPLYLGWNHKRIRGKAYDDFIRLFVQAVKKRFPKVLLQWEDFAKENATRILDAYHDKLCSFNDDIQGTGAIVLATLISAIKLSKVPLKEHRIVIAGAGSAGCGIAGLIVKYKMASGISETEAYSNIYLTEEKGLLTFASSHLEGFQKKFCANRSTLESLGLKENARPPLEDVVDLVKPTILLGLTGRGGLFTKSLIQRMAKFSKRPIIFPLSNPTRCCEAEPEDLNKWTKGKGIISAGSPFPHIKRNNTLMRVDQTNNAYIFPGVGLAVIAAKISRITDEMFIEAAKALATLSPSKKDPQGNLLPPLTESRKISIKIAFVVAKEAMKRGFAKKMSDQMLKEAIKKKIWDPVYQPYIA